MVPLCRTLYPSRCTVCISWWETNSTEQREQDSCTRRVTGKKKPKYTLTTTCDSSPGCWRRSKPACVCFRLRKMWQKRKCSVHNCYLTIAHATVSLSVCVFDSDWVRKEQNTICARVLGDLCEMETFVLYLMSLARLPPTLNETRVSWGSAVTPEERKDRCFPCFLFFPTAKQTSNQTEPAHLPS